MKPLKITFLTICTLASIAWASPINMPDESCKALDVRDSMTQELKDFYMKPSEQGDIGWCFGYAASDVLSQAVGKPLSAVYVSTNYINGLTAAGKFVRSLMHGGPVPEAGFIASAINDMKDLGQACTTEGVPYNGIFKVNSYVSRTGSFLGNLQRLRENRCDKPCQQVVDAGIKYYTAQLKVEDVKKYLIDNKNVELEKAFFALIDSSCGENRVSVSRNIEVETAVQSTLQPGMRGYDETKNLIYSLDSALDKNKVVGLEYNAAHITAAGGTMGGFHASTILARKTINNKCHYLVRNSWGDVCNYRSGIICEKEQGGYWVDKKTLKKMSSKIAWIK